MYLATPGGTSSITPTTAGCVPVTQRLQAVSLLLCQGQPVALRARLNQFTAFVIRLRLAVDEP